MGNYKKEYQMRIIGLIISCLWFINIKAQTDKDMYFDINKYKDWGEISISLSSKYYFKNNLYIIHLNLI